MSSVSIKVTVYVSLNNIVRKKMMVENNVIQFEFALNTLGDKKSQFFLSTRHLPDSFNCSSHIDYENNMKEILFLLLYEIMETLKPDFPSRSCITWVLETDFGSKSGFPNLCLKSEAFSARHSKVSIPFKYAIKLYSINFTCKRGTLFFL